MDKSIIKSLIALSLIIGFIFGILSPIPFIGTIILISVLFLSAPIVIFYLIMDGKLELNSIKESIISGAITGMCANLSYSVTYSIITAIIYVTTKYSSNLILTTMIINSPVWLLLTIIIFMGVLTATTNAFTGLGTYYIINFLRDTYEKRRKNKEENKWLNFNQK